MHTALFAAVLVAAPVAAPQFRPTVAYPIDSDGVPRGLVDSTRAALFEALAGTAPGSLRLVAGDPPSAVCGASRDAPVQCLARLAGSGVVLRTYLKLAERGLLSLTLSAVDAGGRAYGPVRAVIDPVVDDPRVIAGALRELNALIAGRAPPPPAPAPKKAATEWEPDEDL